MTQRGNAGGAIDVPAVMRRCRAAALVLVSGLGCMPAATEQPEPVDATPAATPRVETESAGPVLVEWDGQAPQPLARVAKGAGHAAPSGWTADGTRFGYCYDRPGCRECRFIARDGASESLASGPQCADGIEPQQLDARLAAAPLRSGSTDWEHGDRVVLVVETREQEVTNAGLPRPMLKVGARSQAVGVPIWRLHVDPCQGCGIDQACEQTVHLDGLTLSPDGRELWVLLHGEHADGSQSMRTEQLSVERLVQAASTPASQSRP